MTPGQEAYRKYLQSDDWKKKRRAKLRKARCAVCATDERLDVHHLTYRRWFDVKSADLRVLCRRCHTVVHEEMKTGTLVYRASASNETKWQRTLAVVRKTLARPEYRPWTGPTPDGFVISMDWILGFATANGGWTKDQLRVLEIVWPPKKGWLRGLVGQTITDSQRRRFELLAERHAPSLPVERIEPKHRPLWG